MDRRAFKSLFEETNPGLIKMLVHGWTGPSGKRLYLETLSEAEDVAAEAWRVFLEHEKTGRFDVSRPAAPYVLSIARNVALSRVRRLYTQRDKSQSLAWFFEVDAGNDAHLDVVLERAIDRLGEPEKSIFEAKREGVSEREIGARLELSRDQVRRVYVKGLRALRRYFVQEGVVSESFDALEVAREAAR